MNDTSPGTKVLADATRRAASFSMANTYHIKGEPVIALALLAGSSFQRGLANIERQFVSTSTDPAVARKFVDESTHSQALIITMHNASGVMVPDNVSHYPHEQEILQLPSVNRELLVTSFTGANYYNPISHCEVFEVEHESINPNSYSAYFLQAFLYKKLPSILSVCTVLEATARRSDDGTNVFFKDAMDNVRRAFEKLETDRMIMQESTDPGYRTRVYKEVFEALNQLNSALQTNKIPEGYHSPNISP